MSQMKILLIGKEMQLLVIIGGIVLFILLFIMATNGDCPIWPKRHHEIDCDVDPNEDKK